MQTYTNKIPMRKWAEDDQPSTKLLLKGTSSLSDAELLSIIIGSGLPGGDNPLDIAREILSFYDNNLAELWRTGDSELQAFKGIGEKTAVQILAMFALSRRRSECEILQKAKISCSRDAFDIFKASMGDLPYEEFWLILLNKANKVIKKVRVSEGGVSGTIVDPKKIFQICLSHHTSSIILGHNHPSGNISPSEADNAITTKLVNAGKLLDIAVLDHIIIGYEQFYSFADNGNL
jgi:DNA repair protein RadC